MRIKSKKKRGFTLIEVMVVISIIVLLAGVMLPKITGYVEEVKKTEVVNQARNVMMAVETVNIKRSGTVDGSDTVSQVVTKIEKINKALLNSEMIDKLNDTTVDKCKEIVDTKKYEVQLNGDIFKSTEEIGSSK